MYKKNKNKNQVNHEISELNNNPKRTHINFSLEPVNSKPFDISLMTGNNQTNNKGSEEK